MARTRDMMAADEIATYSSRWGLVADGDSFRTRTSWLRPVVCDGLHALLKVPFVEEERAGIPVLAWYGGVGAARVLRSDLNAVVMERLADDISLPELAAHDDAEATRILCGVVAELHRPRLAAPPPLTSMRDGFRALEAAAAAGSGRHATVLAAAWKVARRLIEAPAPSIVLHGDMHHANVLHDPRRGWVAVDPKGMVGNPALDYAKILYNPTAAIAHRPGRLRAQAAVIAAQAGISEREVLEWSFAQAALSACWSIESGSSGGDALTVARLAAREVAIDLA
jgi:streptomycin 6-kinase